MQRSTYLLFTILLVIVSPALAKKSKRNKTTPRPAELTGSKEQRIEQNTKAVNLGIGEILNDEELEVLVSKGVLVELTDTDYYFVDRGPAPTQKSIKKKTSRSHTRKPRSANCPPKEKRVLVYPWVKTYLDQRARDYFLQSHKYWKITSGARSLKEQRLMRTKGSCYYTPYAAKADGPLEESLHVRAIAFDISRLGMGPGEIKWMRDTLVEDKRRGVEFELEDREDLLELETEPIEERICYHVVVFPRNRN